jgi:type IV secretion system protein VirB5
MNKITQTISFAATTLLISAPPPLPLVGIAAIGTFAFAQASNAQGVPVIDGTNLARNIEQLQAALRDAENQISQIEELRRQVELQIEQITV